MYCIGLDIGGTKCAVSAGTLGERIEITDRREIPTLRDPVATLDNLTDAIENLLSKGEASAIGISCGGPLDVKRGVILKPPNLLGWHHFPIVDYIREKFRIPAYLQNDANACALAEWKYGAGKGTENMIFLTFGTGLGAGLILDGRLYEGANGNAGEVGHIRLANSGPFGYGKHGSFEGFCSGGGIANLAIAMSDRCKQTPRCIEAMGGRDFVTTKKLAQFAFGGDAFAKRVFAKSGEMLGRGLSVLIDLFNPERIVLGGVFMRSHELLEPSMYRAIEREALSDCASVVQIVPAELHENIGDYAALCVAENKR